MKVLKKALKNLFRNPITTRYPKATFPPPDGFRGKPKVYRKKCIGCGFCTRECPTEAIKLKRCKAEIDLRKCIFCGVCQDVCPFDAIKLGKDFEMANYRKKLIVK